MAAYATMEKAPVCTAELIMLAHARLPSNQRPPCGDMHLVWLLIGKELGDQLSKRRGVRLEGLGDIILTVDGIRLVKGGNLRGARPAHPLNLAAIAKAANARGVCSSAASRDGVARTARAVISELMRLANRRRQASLSLRPVGSVVSRKARSETEEGVDLIVEDEFQCRTALAWDKNLQSTGQPFGSRVRGFRQDDRARSRATVAPPVYRGRGKAVLREEMTSSKASALIRKRAHDRHGPDGLSIIARCLKACFPSVNATTLKNALEDAGVASTPEERNALIENDSSIRTVEKSLAFPNALSTERRMIIDEAWAELQQRHFEREKARQKGARKDGSGIEPGVVSLAVLKQRIDGDWHPAVQSGRADEEAVVTRLLAFLDIDETSCSECTRQQFRASLARLSASYNDDDAFDKAVKGCWKLEAATKPYVAPPRKERPPPVIKVAWPSQPQEEEDEVSTTMPVGRWNDEDDAYEGLESRTTMAMLEELRMLTYEPVCDATEFRRRLGGPPDVIGLEDLARRLRRRAASADLAVSARKAARLSVVAVEFAGGDTSMRCDDFHRELAVLFGRDRDTILQTRRPLATAPSSSLRKALEGVDQNALMEADQFIELFDKAHIGCQARHVRAAVARACRAAGLPQPRGALGERDWASPAALLELCRGGPLNARRSKLVSRAFDLLTKRLGEPVIASKLAALLPGAPISNKPAPPARQAFLEAVGGARARVSVDTFRAVFEDLSSGVEGDFAFAKLLANCWDVAPWPAAADAVEEEEVFSEFDADDDGQRGLPEDRYFSTTGSRQ